jgi:NADPH-dependent 2,4-dienoyl-CoA reductase/sulfur reductase-like enzyme
MTSFELVIAGGGLTAARAIKSYREAGGGARIALLAAERHLPYHRPALSKRYLRGEAGPPFAEDEAFYREHEVELLLGAEATAVDPMARVVVSTRGPLRYDKLLIATGATPRRLPVAGAELDGVYSLRTLDDSDRIRDAARASARAVVVGGGFIGMEVAASLRQLGVEHLTLIHLGRGLFDQLRSPALSEQLLSLYRDNGVDVLLEHEVARFGGHGRLEWVETANGDRVAADLAVVGVGVVPNVAFLAGSGIAVDNGVVVSERFEANAPGVFAAGDVANFFDPLFGRQRRIEHWSNASYQGGEVGRILAGQSGGYDAVSSFFSEVFGTTIKVFGDTSRFDTLDEEGLLDDRFLASYGDAGRLVGAITVGQSEELETLIRELIAERAPTNALGRELVGGSA